MLRSSILSTYSSLIFNYFNCFVKKATFNQSLENIVSEAEVISDTSATLFDLAFIRKNVLYWNSVTTLHRWQPKLLFIIKNYLFILFFRVELCREVEDGIEKKIPIELWGSLSWEVKLCNFRQAEYFVKRNPFTGFPLDRFSVFFNLSGIFGILNDLFCNFSSSNK